MTVRKIKLFNDDCLGVLPTLEKDSISMVICSPPYGQARTYENTLEWSDVTWLKIIDQLWRIIKPGGVCCWIVGDTVEDGSDTCNPFLQALDFKGVGFNVRTMFYKKTGMPFCDQSFYYRNMEYIFICSKGKPATFNPIEDRANKFAGGKQGGKNRDQAGNITSTIKPHKTPDFGRRTVVWEYSNSFGHGTTDKEAYDHPATFPERLVRDLMLSWSKEGDLVCDPMCGSGTVGKVAKQLGRSFIGIEKVKKYFEIGKRRIEKTRRQLTIFKEF